MNDERKADQAVMRRVVRLQADIARLAPGPGAPGADAFPKVLALMAEAELLLSELRSTRDRIGQKLGNVLAGQKARQAYGQAAMTRKAR